MGRVPGPHRGGGGSGAETTGWHLTSTYMCLASAELGLEPTSLRPHGRPPGAGLHLRQLWFSPRGAAEVQCQGRPRDPSKCGRETRAPPAVSSGLHSWLWTTPGPPLKLPGSRPQRPGLRRLLPPLASEGRGEPLAGRRAAGGLGSVVPPAAPVASPAGPAGL